LHLGEDDKTGKSQIREGNRHVRENHTVIPETGYRVGLRLFGRRAPIIPLRESGPFEVPDVIRCMLCPGGQLFSIARFVCDESLWPPMARWERLYHERVARDFRRRLYCP
jgi:hypothetical protein